MPFYLFAQKDSSKVQGDFFANIYSNFSYIKSENTYNSGFGMPTALFGYSRNISKKVTGTIIFDVTRTTNIFQITNPNGTIMNVSYFEGSKYTAFLKMAEIKWSISPKFTFSAGQLLNTQYLTLQDKFWEHRYVEVTFQELNRLGMPADFGMRLTFEPTNKLKLNVGAFNGEGPFRYQDENSNFLFSGNIEYKPFESVVLKAYYSEHFSNDSIMKNQGNLSLFLGYKIKKLTLGLEFDHVENQYFIPQFVTGFSGFVFYNFTEKFQIFYRYDFMSINSNFDISYHIAGIQFSPVKKFFFSLNFRYKKNYLLQFEHQNMVYLNLGLKI